MNEPIEFGFYDPAEGVEQTKRFLPHWFQPNVATFITFRTADSMPRDVVRRWQEEQRVWLAEQGIVIAENAELPPIDALPSTVRNQFLKHRTGRWHWHLDSCHGVCLLRDRELAKLVMDAIRHFDGERYDLDSAVVMPNHVHILVQFRPGITCRKQCESWLRYSARQLNIRLGRTGPFWQSEPFDHLVRSGDQFEYLQRYIAENGRRANLRESEYLYWRRAC